MFNNFFRKDLELEKKAVHRFLKVVFWLLFAYAIWFTYNELFVDDNSYVPMWVVSANLEDRIDYDLNQIKDLKRLGEKVEEADRGYILNYQKESLYDDLYCSKDLTRHLDKVQMETGITNFYIGGVYNREPVSQEEFQNYIMKNNVICLIPDAFNYSDFSRIEFLQPLTSQSLYSTEIAFYEKSFIFTAFEVLKWFGAVIGIFIGIVIVYYKVILYIKFGSPKNND